MGELKGAFAMNMYDLKSGEPFFGRWYIKDCIGTTRTGSMYLIYSIESGVSVYSTMKVIGVPNDKQEFLKDQLSGIDSDNSMQYYQELVTDMYREICLIEKLSDRSHIVSYIEHMIFQRGNAVGYNVFLRMEYLQGVKDGSFTHDMNRQEIIQMGKDICEALCVCEENHIVHGDIHPEAIYITRDRRFKLGDFSFTRYCKQTDLVLTYDNYSDYMAPEVYEGKAYDIRADIYSLGLVLYQYLNNHRLPYLETGIEEATLEQRQGAMKQRLEADKLPNPCNASDELAKVIGKALELDPNMRYQSAEEFKDALTAIGVFLSSDASELVKEHTEFNGIYVKNEIVAKIPQSSEPTIYYKKSRERELEMEREANVKNMGPWILIFLVMVFTTSVIVLLTNVNYAKQTYSNSEKEVHISNLTPTNQIELTPIANVTDNPEDLEAIANEEPSSKPTQQPDNTAAQTLDPTTIIQSGQKLSDLSTITRINQAITIDLSNNKLSDIDALSEATMVENLVLSNNQIVSVEPLRDLHELKALDVSNNSVASFVMLRKLENLVVLSASNNLITSLAGLEKMTSLQFLYLNDNLIEDINVLKYLKSLKLIDLSNNKVKKDDIEKLKEALPDCIIIE